MNWSQVGAALLALSLSSYALAAEPEDLLGTPRLSGSLAKGAAVGPAPALPSVNLVAPGRADRYAKVLGALQPDTGSTTRGAKESEVYQKVSPSVVLVVAANSLGSGALVSADGLIITNLHVVGTEKEVGVVFKPATEGQTISKADVRKATVIRRDEVADLALLKVDEVPAGLTPLVVAGVEEIQVGSDVHAIGHPTGEAWTYTRGIVSQIRRDYQWHAEDRLAHKATVIQTQTPINPGNSGGPLIDDNLHIVGINSFTAEGEGLNFAVSANDVKAFMERTDDRTSVASAAAPGEKCELAILERGRSEDDDADEFLIDFDCDGKGDAQMISPDSKKKPGLIMFDDDGDGKIDTVIVDEGRDGNFDFALYDTDGNGKTDMIGEYRKGEDEPYKYERIKEKG